MSKAGNVFEIPEFGLTDLEAPLDQPIGHVFVERGDVASGVDREKWLSEGGRVGVAV